MHLKELNIRAGFSFNKYLKKGFENSSITVTEAIAQPQDCRAIMVDDTEVWIEYKEHDFIGSVFGKGIDGILTWELWEQYLPQRAMGIAKEIWLFVVLDVQRLDKRTLSALETCLEFCFEHRIPVKICESMSSAIYSSIKSLTNYQTPIDLSLPLYINAEKRPSRTDMMVRLRHGMTDMKIIELKKIIQPWSWAGIVDYIRCAENYPKLESVLGKALTHKFSHLVLTGEDI